MSTTTPSAPDPGLDPGPNSGARFDDAANAVLDHLSTIVPMDSWAVTRRDGDRQLYLQVRDSSYGFAAGDSRPWNETLCASMVAGPAPQIAPDVKNVALYASAAEASGIEVGAYIGIPMRRSDGELFGTLCGMDRSQQSESMIEHAPLFALLSTLLTTIFEADLACTEQARVLEQVQRAAEVDPLTGLLNRHGWARFIELEEERLRRFGDPSAVIVVELERVQEINATRGHQAGDGYIELAAAAIRNTVRGADVVARLGGDEFGVIVTGITPNVCELLVDRILDAFRSDGVTGSIGWAPYTVADGFSGAIAAADAAMDEDKQQRSTRAGRLTLVR